MWAPEPPPTQPPPTRRLPSTGWVLPGGLCTVAKVGKAFPASRRSEQGQKMGGERGRGAPSEEPKERIFPTRWKKNFLAAPGLLLRGAPAGGRLSPRRPPPTRHSPGGQGPTSERAVGTASVAAAAAAALGSGLVLLLLLPPSAPRTAFDSGPLARREEEGPRGPWSKRVGSQGPDPAGRKSRQRSIQKPIELHQGPLFAKGPCPNRGEGEQMDFPPQLQGQGVSRASHRAHMSSRGWQTWHPTGSQGHCVGHQTEEQRFCCTQGAQERRRLRKQQQRSGDLRLRTHTHTHTQLNTKTFGSPQTPHFPPPVGKGSAVPPLPHSPPGPTWTPPPPPSGADSPKTTRLVSRAPAGAGSRCGGRNWPSGAEGGPGKVPEEALIALWG